MLRSLAGYIETHADDPTEFIVGSNLFVGFVPHDTKADEYCALLERVGQTCELDFPEHRQIRVQAFFKNRSYRNGETLGKWLANLLANHKSFPIDDWWIYQTEVTGPSYMGQDENGRHEFTMNFTVHAKYGEYYQDEYTPPSGGTQSDSDRLDSLAWFVRALAGDADGVLAYSSAGSNSLKVIPQTPASKSVRISAGAAFIDGVPVRVLTPIDTADFRMPGIHPSRPVSPGWVLIDLVQMSSDGVVKVIEGTQTNVVPATTAGYLALARIYHGSSGGTVIKAAPDGTNSYIVDARTFLNV